MFVQQHIITFIALSQHLFRLLTVRFSFMLLSHQNFTIAVVFWLAHIKAPTNIYREFRKQLYERWLLLDWGITLLQWLNLFTVTCVDFKILLMLKCLYGVSPTYHSKLKTWQPTCIFNKFMFLFSSCLHFILFYFCLPSLCSPFPFTYM